MRSKCRVSLKLPLKMDKLSSDSAPERRVMFHISRFLESNPDYKLTDQEQECLDKNHSMLQRNLLIGTVVLSVGSWFVLDISLITKKPRRIPLFTSQLALVSSVAFLAT